MDKNTQRRRRAEAKESFAWLHSILCLPWHALLSKLSPWPQLLRPIPVKFDSWKHYVESFRDLAIEEFRATLGQTLQKYQFGGLQFWKFKSMFLLEKNCKDTILWDPKAQLNSGDVCLVSAEDLSDRKFHKPKRSWHICGWMLIKERLERNAAQVSCLLFKCKGKLNGKTVFLAPLESAITTSRILMSLALHKSEPDFDASSIHKDFTKLIQFGKVSPCSGTAVNPIQFDATTLSHLNESQQKAVRECMTGIARPGSTVLIQGPPGTGKTKCIVTLLRLLLPHPASTILLAPTNVAVLDVARKLVCDPRHPVDPERVFIVVNDQRDNVKPLLDEALSQYVLSFRVTRLIESTKKLIEDLVKIIDGSHNTSDCDSSVNITEVQQKRLQAIKDLVRSHKSCCSVWPFTAIDEHLDQIRFCVENQKHGVACAQIRELQSLDTKHLHKNELEQFDKKLVAEIKKDLLGRAFLIFSTLSGSKSKLLLKLPFQIAIVDECAQAIEAEMIGIFKASLKTMIMVGDPEQLSGAVFSPVCVKYRYQESLLQRLASSHPIHLLQVQYRMHPAISTFPNKTFYSGRIMDGDNVKAYRPAWYSSQFQPMQFLSHEGSNFAQDAGRSSFNGHEARCIAIHLGEFLQTNPTEDLVIGLIAPYAAQRILLEKEVVDLRSKMQFSAEIKVSTVDGFQGQECDIIVISLTRTRSSTAFLEQRNRMNVAATRAKYALWIFGDHQLFAKKDRSRIWCCFTTHCKKTGILKKFQAVYETGSMTNVRNVSDEQFKSNPIVIPSKKGGINRMTSEAVHAAKEPRTKADPPQNIGAKSKASKRKDTKANAQKNNGTGSKANIPEGNETKVNVPERTVPHPENNVSFAESKKATKRNKLAKANEANTTTIPASESSTTLNKDDSIPSMAALFEKVLISNETVAAATAPAIQLDLSGKSSTKSQFQKSKRKQRWLARN